MSNENMPERFARSTVDRAVAESRDLLARYTNPEGFKPEDLVAVGKYVVISRATVREVKIDGDGEKKLIIAPSAKAKDEVKEVFSRVISIGPEVTCKFNGRDLHVGDWIVYGNSMGFAMAGHEAFWDTKIVHELNILSVVRRKDELTDNLLLRERFARDAAGAADAGAGENGS